MSVTPNCALAKLMLANTHRHTQQPAQTTNMYFQHKGLLCVGTHPGLRDHYIRQALSLCLTTCYLNPYASTPNYSSRLFSFVITPSSSYRFTLPLTAGPPMDLDAEHTGGVWSCLSWFCGNLVPLHKGCKLTEFQEKQLCISTLELIEKECFGWVTKGCPCIKTCWGDIWRGFWYIKGFFLLFSGVIVRRRGGCYLPEPNTSH